MNGTRPDEFAPFKPCEYLRWGAGYSSSGSQPVNTWFGNQPGYTVQTFLPQRRAFFTTELQKHPFPPGVQPGPNPQPLYLELPPVTVTPMPQSTHPAPEGQSVVAILAELSPLGLPNIIRFTLDGSEPSAVEFPAWSQGWVDNYEGVPRGHVLDSGVYLTVPEGTVVRARNCLVKYRTAAPPQDSDSIVEAIYTQSPLVTVTVP